MGKLVLKKKLVAKKAPAKVAKAAKTKRAGGKATRVNFDMDTATYTTAAETAKKFEKSVSSAGRLFLSALVELGTNGAKSAIAKAAHAIITQETPEGSRVPNGLGKKKAVAAPKAKVKAPAAKAAVVAKPKPTLVAKASPVLQRPPPPSPNGAVRPPVPKLVLRLPLKPAAQA